MWCFGRLTKPEWTHRCTLRSWVRSIVHRAPALIDCQARINGSVAPVQPISQNFTLVFAGLPLSVFCKIQQALRPCCSAGETDQRLDFFAVGLYSPSFIIPSGR